jgi:hypothetical protein
METEAGPIMSVCFYENKKLGSSNIGVTWKIDHDVTGLDPESRAIYVNR